MTIHVIETDEATGVRREYVKADQGDRMTTIRIPNSPAPKALLCWETPPLDGSRGNPMVHCDRKAGHSGQHSWEGAVAPDLRALVYDDDGECYACGALASLRFHGPDCRLTQLLAALLRSEPAE